MIGDTRPIRCIPARPHSTMSYQHLRLEIDGRLATVHLVCENLPGALARVASALSDLGADIEASSSSVAADGRGVQHFEITHRSTPANLRAALQALDGVQSVSVS